MQPPPPASRLPAIDALRGAAMLGIVLVNFPTMNTMAGDETWTYGAMRGPLDRLVGGANLLLLNGKCYPIFALLFGLGLHLLGREDAGAPGRPRAHLPRRLLVLLGVGLLHLLLVWWGDILIVYALLGLLLLPALRWPARRLLAAALTLLLPVQALPALLGLLDRLGVPAAGRVLLPGLGLALPSREAAAATYAHGTFEAMLRQRLLDWVSDFTPFAGGEVTLGLAAGYGAYYVLVLGMMLLGLWAGRRGLHERYAADPAWAWRALRRLAPLAAALTALRLGAPDLAYPLGPYQAIALALTYVLALGLLLPRLGPASALFEAVGRLSLTAYLAHTTLCSLLLYGTGLGLYGRVGPAALLPLSLAAYALIAWGCIAWSRRFRLGPAEWAWRSLVQGRRLPLARG